MDNLFISLIDRDTVLCSFKFLNSVNENCPSLMLCSATELLMYYMMAFLCDDKELSAEDIKNFLQDQVTKFLERNEFTYFNFDTTIGNVNDLHVCNQLCN